jgi:hypothetical protein
MGSEETENASAFMQHKLVALRTSLHASNGSDLIFSTYG